MDPLLRTRLLACPGLPTLPAVALEVLELCRRDDEDLDGIAAAVERDPAISAKLLRLGNSASLATRGKVTTLSRAIAIIGTNATVSTALSFSLLRTRRRGERAGFDHGAFWRRSLFCGIAGRALAEPLGLDPEEAFLACLLQDLGQLALGEVFPADYGIVASAAGSHGALAELERDALGTDHLEAGLLLAELWNLPEPLRAAIAESHAPAEITPGAPRALGEAVFLSGPLAEVWIGPGTPSALERAVAAAEQAFGPVAALVRAALTRMALAVPEASTDFDLDLGGPDRVEAVLAEANAFRLARGEPAAQAPVAALAADADQALGAALARAVEHGQTLAVLLVGSPLGAAGEAALPVVRASLRGTDVVAPRRGAVLAVLFDPAPGSVAQVIARLQRRASEAGLPFAIGVAEHRAGAAPPQAEALLAEAGRNLERARAEWTPGEPAPRRPGWRAC